MKTKTYSVSWSHTVDSRARPGTSFSAFVNASSTKYNRFVPNSPQMNFQNIQTSSITYAKSWAGKPYNLTLSANHSQNNYNHLINLNLPDVGFTVNTLYPFERKNSVGSTKWYEKLGVGYYGNFRNQVSFYDTAFQLSKLIDTLQWVLCIISNVGSSATHFGRRCYSIAQYFLSTGLDSTKISAAPGIRYQKLDTSKRIFYRS
jgi:hypothetical protein